MNHLNALLASGDAFSVMFMDLDRFKAVNDRYGHLLGDAYLRHFASVSAGILEGYGELYRFAGMSSSPFLGALPRKALWTICGNAAVGKTAHLAPSGRSASEFCIAIRPIATGRRPSCRQWIR